ncbi:Norsolorinic acid ketoreductase [Madurella mycetomatis]|uniref:Norsolorinic acid ketoreductase n=1 Tax=Madurella mycetomatis TaxID=100816 RepID=A0A175VQM9_9PEZI|nr:Norsolorinic acid ketoreductase [Madurella mycetomatis]
MSDNTIYLITGANRGIGLHLTALLLARPNTTVIATSRTPSITPASIPGTLHPTSKLIPFLLDESNPVINHASLRARLAAEYPDVTRLDVVVANAGGSSGFKDVLGTEPEEIARDLEVNTLGAVRLFQAVVGLLLGEGGDVDGVGEEDKGRKRFVVVSSSVGSIGALEMENFPGVGYGMSKAATNWWARKVSLEFAAKGLLVGVLHPGWVKTAMGQAMADAVGFPEPPLSSEESAKGVLTQIENLTPEKSGQFLAWNGMNLPW